MDVVERVFKELPHGRIASWDVIAKYMMTLVLQGGDRNHLEIGVLHGGTLIMAALTKMEAGLNGKIIGIDPLKGYYPASPLHPSGPTTIQGRVLSAPIDGPSETPVNREILEKNLRAFGVQDRVEIVEDFSYPWPLGDDIEFGTVYIDGDHYGKGPMVDWESVSPKVLVGGLVWFDDCNDNCPGVKAACEQAASTPGWTVHEHFQNQTYVVKRVSS